MKIFIEFLQTTMVVFVVLVVITITIYLNKKRIKEFIYRLWNG